jgi:hypothetical protein
VKRRVHITVAVAVLALMGAAPSRASVHVAKGDTVNELRVLGQDVRVDGRVRGPVLLIAGNLSVGAAGEVSNVTIIGGRIETVPGARLQGDLFQLGGSTPDLSGWKLTLALFGLFAVRTLFVWLILLASDALTQTRVVAPLVQRLEAATARTLLTGILGSLGAIALSAIVALTLVGLPVALMLWGSLLLLLVAGVAATLRALELGAEKRRGVFVALAMPVVGDTLLAFALAAGVGSALRWLGTSGRDAEPAGISLR